MGPVVLDLQQRKSGSAGGLHSCEGGNIIRMQVADIESGHQAEQVLIRAQRLLIVLKSLSVLQIADMRA